MAEPRKVRRTVETITYRDVYSGDRGVVNIRRNRTNEETREQYMRLMGDIQRQWRAGVDPRIITERQRRLTGAYARTMTGLSATRRGWEPWMRPGRLVTRRNNRT